MTEPTTQAGIERLSIPVGPAVRWWLAAFLAIAVPVNVWLLRHDSGYEAAFDAWIGPWIASTVALLVVVGVRRPYRFRHPGFLRLAFSITIATPLLVMPVVPPHLSGTAATVLYTAVFSAAFAAVVAASHVPADGGPLRKIANWTGLWAPANPDVAGATPISWHRAVRSWLLLWPLCTGLIALWAWAGYEPHLSPTDWWRLIAVGPCVAFSVAEAGLVGSKRRPRTRHRGWTLVGSVAVGGLFAFVICGGLGLLIRVSATGAIVWSFTLTTVIFGLVVAVTHLPDHRSIPVHSST